MFKYIVLTVFSGLMIFACQKSLANSIDTSSPQSNINNYIEVHTICDTILNSTSTDSISLQSSVKEKTLSKKKSLTDNKKKKKWIAAISAFPFPLGFVGGHRIMLGTKPWVPVVYIATFGGCFGLLPLIDFCVILCSKDIEQYENNPNIFMWIK